MNILKYISHLIFTLLLFSAAYADVFSYPVRSNTSVSIEQHIPQPDILRSDFKQIKTIVGMQKDLFSSGRIIYAKDRGFYFEIKAPFAVTYIFTKKGLMQIEDGKKDIIPAEQQAFFHEFSRILQSIFSGRYEELSKHFTIYFTHEGKKWSLGLRPLNSVVSGVIKEITVTGGNNAETITFTEKSGDSTRMQLSNNTSSALTNDEENYFIF